MDIERLKELQIAKQVLMLNKAVVEYELATSKEDQDFIKAVETAIALIDEAIARQSVKSEEVQEAIEYLQPLIEYLQPLTGHSVMSENFVKHLKTVITALQAYQPVKSEEVQVEINRLKKVLSQTKEAEKELREQKYTVNMLPVHNQIKSLEMQITALQAYQPWIPVSNVKPEKSGRYIAYVPEHWTNEGHKEGKVIIAYFRELNYEGKRRVWDDGAYGISGEVTHYLPLPEPPKGE